MMNKMRFVAAAVVATVAGCGGGEIDTGTLPTMNNNNPGTDGGQKGGVDADAPPDTSVLGLRQLNLGQALRTASLKLVGDLPTLAEQQTLARAPNPRLAYEQQVDKYLADPRFATQAIAFHRNVFKIGGAANRETAPALAAMLVVKDRPYTGIFTASAMTCPTLDAKTGVFTDGDCKNGVARAAGVLTDPGVQAHYMSSMAFRRARWVQETFACRKFPAEYTHAPVAMGAGQYTSPWPFDSIAGGSSAPVDFHDVSAVICANCHSTMNHVAPLFANFDAMGMWQSTVQVTTPVMGLPKTKMTDWLPTGEHTSWRLGVEVSDIPALGETLAKDPDVIDCTVARVWNYAMSKGDIVGDLSTVPESVKLPLRATYTTGYSWKATLRAALTSDDFVKF